MYVRSMRVKCIYRMPQLPGVGWVVVLVLDAMQELTFIRHWICLLWQLFVDVGLSPRDAFKVFIIKIFRARGCFPLEVFHMYLHPIRCLRLPKLGFLVIAEQLDILGCHVADQLMWFSFPTT